MPDASWNIYRYAADYLHFGGMVFGLLMIYSTRSVQGFSRKTQVLYQLVYITRYIDVITESQVRYLVFFKVIFNVITASMLMSFAIFHHTYDVVADSCNLVAILVPTFIAAFIVASDEGLQQELWTWSEFIEPFALVPQYIVLYRAKEVRRVSLLYVAAVGGYRLLYVCNWIYKRWTWHQAYHDYTSWIGGGLECILFFDFLFRILQRRDAQDALSVSWLGKVLLDIDDSAGKLSEAVELRTIGRRLPYGLSGSATKGEEKGWDAADKLADEEGCKLLTLSEDDNL